MDKSKEECNVFVMIFNIPSSYSSSALRIYFNQLIESSAFEIFHYKHRPMQKLLLEGESTSIGRTELKTQTETPEETHQLNNSTNDKTQHEQKQIACCCLALCQLSCYNRLQAAYHLHHWKDAEGRNHPTQCFTYPVYCVIDEDDDVTSRSLSPEFTITKSLYSDTGSSGKLYMPYKDIIQFKELNPPQIMPHGNVGTPTKHFLELINSCQLPPVIVRKLGLKFKKEGGKLYSTVAYDYGSGKNQSTQHTGNILVGPAVTGNKHKIIDHDEYVEEQVLQRRMQQDKERNKPHRKLMDGDQPSTSKGVNNEECDDEPEEEWDRHERFYDDPANYERNKERLFEEKIELKWEKGGSGLVFYTDAQYWKQLEGDFDEQTADDWDVDMSEYEEVGSGDKDARDYMQMRREDRLRGDLATLQEISAFDKPIGSFEKHTKGVGRTVLEKQGWKDGKGVGREEDGTAHIIQTDGQHPRDKTGLGFFGEKVIRYVKPSRKRRADGPIITTIYDEQEVTDEPDTLLERSNPHNIKHRTKHID